MSKPVTDPALLELLNSGGGASAQPKQVTDPDLLEQLNMTPEQAKRLQMANEYAGEDVRKMGATMRFLGGAKTALDRAAYGLKDIFTDLTPEEIKLLEQGKAFVQESGRAGKVGDVVGDVAITAAPATKLYQGARLGLTALPKAAQFLSSPLAAATSGAVVGGVTNPLDTSGGAVSGAVGGVVGDVAGRALVKTLGGLVSKNVTPDARKLLDDDVFVPMWKATDSKLTRNIAERARALPMTGEYIRGQERSAFESFNKHMAGKATPPMPVLDEAGNVLRWESSPVKEFGNDAINALKGRFDDAYGALYRGRGVPVDDIYGKTTSEIVDYAKAYYPHASTEVAAAMRQADDILRTGTETTLTASPIVNQAGKPFINKELGHATTSPESVKKAIDALDERITTAYRKGDEETASLLVQLRENIADLRTRGLPPEVAAQAQEINKAYAGFKQMQRANASIGAQTGGVTTPAQMLNAIKANDRSPGKSAFASGNALNQQDVLTAQRVLGNRLPDVGPGTAEKLLPVIGFGLPMLGYDSGAMALLGTKTGQRALMGDLAGQAFIRKYGSQYLVPALRSLGITSGN